MPTIADLIENYDSSKEPSSELQEALVEWDRAGARLTDVFVEKELFGKTEIKRFDEIEGKKEDFFTKLFSAMEQLEIYSLDINLSLSSEKLKQILGFVSKANIGKLSIGTFAMGGGILDRQDILDTLASLEEVDDLTLEVDLSNRKNIESFTTIFKNNRVAHLRIGSLTVNSKETAEALGEMLDTSGAEYFEVLGLIDGDYLPKALENNTNIRHLGVGEVYHPDQVAALGKVLKGKLWIQTLSLRVLGLHLYDPEHTSSTIGNLLSTSSTAKTNVKKIVEGLNEALKKSGVAKLDLGNVEWGNENVVKAVIAMVRDTKVDEIVGLEEHMDEESKSQKVSKSFEKLKKLEEMLNNNSRGRDDSGVNAPGMMAPLLGDDDLEKARKKVVSGGATEASARSSGNRGGSVGRGGGGRGGSDVRGGKYVPPAFVPSKFVPPEQK